MAGRFTNKEKAQEARRELGLRRYVYRDKVTTGKMQQAAADRYIALMEEMLADYERLDAADRPDMFAQPTQAASYAHERPASSADPTYNKTPGRLIDRQGQRWETCKCGESILVGQVRDALKGTLVTHRWDAQPVVHDNQNYYTRHRCG